MPPVCGERTSGSSGWAVTRELMSGWGCAWLVHENPTGRPEADNAR